MSEIENARIEREALEDVAGRKAIGTERSYDALRRYLGAEAYALNRARVSPLRPAVGEPADGAEAITVRPAGIHGYRIAIRAHRLLVDQPVADGGEDRGPQPLELFVAGLAACVATYAGDYLTRHGFGTGDLSVGCEFDRADDRPARVAAIRIRITLPDGLPPQRRQAVLRVARHCTVLNTLERSPRVDIDLAS